MPIAPPPRTSSLVIDAMLARIQDGTWAVGHRIPAEPDLVTEFGVGRNTIREAVRALEHAGLLAPRRGDGTFVRTRNVLTEALARSADRSGLVDLLTTRRALESEAAALAAQAPDHTDVTALRVLRARAVDAWAAGDTAAHADADIAFHRAVVERCGNRLLVELYDGLSEVIRRAHARVAATTHHRDPDGHDTVLDAIAAGDPDAARGAVYSYLDDALNGLR
ncbi:MAG: FCD domain-containing protein [Gordonia sp. (in: high G+C Gram-positive bacteria)]